MIIILHPDTQVSDPGYDKLMEYLNGLQRIQVRKHDVVGAEQTLTELYLVGNTSEHPQFLGPVPIDNNLQLL